MSHTKHKCPSEESSDCKKHKTDCDKAAGADAGSGSSCDKAAAGCDKDIKDKSSECSSADNKPQMPKIKLEKNDKGYALSYAIVYVSDMTHSVKFYKELFGFKTRYESEYWTEFDTGTTALSLHKVDKIDHTRKLDASNPHPGQGAIGWFVPCSKSFHEHALKLGVKVVEEPAKQFWGGIRATYADPDGGVISVVENAFS